MKRLLQKMMFLVVMAVLSLPLSLSGQSNQYLHFDKEDDFVILENASQYFSGTNQLTIAGWFYCDALAYGQGYMGFRIGSGTAEFYLIQLNNGVLECRLLTTTGLHEYVSPANTVIPQVWQHIAWVFDGTSIKLYVNGTLKGSSAASGVFQGENVPFAIGKSVLGGFNFVYGGRVDEVSAWSKALTQSEIQEMIDNELTGNEDDLHLYYKFNQGEPGGNNTSITHLLCELGSGERDAELMNFALVGETSNFNGTLNPGYQAISFPQIPNHLTTDDPFEVEVSATSGLEVILEVTEGPASVEGHVVTLTGEPGQVTILATQPGDDTYDPAAPISNSFMVIDPAVHVPEIDVRHPLAGDVYVPELSPIKLSAISTIEYPELFWVSNVHFLIEGEYIPSQKSNANHYNGWWTPPAYGSYSIAIHSTSNFGAARIENVNINIVSSSSNMMVVAAEDIWINPANVSEVVEAELPSFHGAFNNVMATLEVTCPPGGCGEWDRLASVDAKNHEGEWIEIIRYITPYGVACSHAIDLTDYVSLLSGKIAFRFNCETLDNGFLYKLILDYNAGTPDFPYSSIHVIWKDNYPFGDYANLQPVENQMFEFPDNATAATLKLVSTGHGWGNLNTGNAAEFYDATHHIWVNGEETFEQHNWATCNPNPDGCQPQNGTWTFNRAGWCPGSIAPWFDYDMSAYVSDGMVDLGYVFYEDYMDYCHPNHPDCVTGVTCTDCDDGFNPHLEVACNIVVFSGSPILNVPKQQGIPEFVVRPNPNNGVFNIYIAGTQIFDNATIHLYSATGLLMDNFIWSGDAKSLDYTGLPKGVYILTLQSAGNREIRKLIIQ
jgi:hypothetical protein